MRLVALLALILTGLAGCAALAEPRPEPFYYVMRHLHTPAGERDPDLTAEGRNVASLVPFWFRDQASPRAIYVSSFKRTALSAAPLAETLGLAPIIYDPSDTPALIQRVRSGPKPALIVGHSNTVPDIVEQLGGSRPDPLAHEDFADIWIIGADGSTARATLDEAPQAR